MTNLKKALLYRYQYHDRIFGCFVQIRNANMIIKRPQEQYDTTMQHNKYCDTLTSV